jgi:hypothetical protein
LCRTPVFGPKSFWPGAAGLYTIAVGCSAGIVDHLLTGFLVSIGSFVLFGCCFGFGRCW